MLLIGVLLLLLGERLGVGNAVREEAYKRLLK